MRRPDQAVSQLLHRHVLQPLPVAHLRAVQDRAAETELVDQRKRRKPQKLQAVRDRVQVPAGIAAGSRLDPPHVLLEAELGQQRPQMPVGEQRHVIVTIPHDIVEAPRARQSAQVRRGLEEGDAVAGCAKRWASVRPSIPPPTIPQRRPALIEMSFATFLELRGPTAARARSPARAALRSSDRRRRRPARAFGKRAVIETQERLAAATHAADRAGRMTDDEMEVRHRPRDDRSHSHHAPAPDDQIAPDHAARADRRTLRARASAACARRVRMAASVDRSGIVARGKRSFVNTVPALIITPSSIVTPAQM